MQVLSVGLHSAVRPGWQASLDFLTQNKSTR
jgi:hypothetical protein